jgi:hypothetical protein
LEVPAATDITARVKQLEGLVATAEFEYFFDRLLDFANDFGDKQDVDEVLLKCGSFAEIKIDLRKGTITEEQFKAYRGKFVLAALAHKHVIYEAVIVRSPRVPLGSTESPAAITPKPPGNGVM